MRILILTSRLPYPPDRGDRSRVYNFMKHLSRAHELSLASFIAKESEQEHLASLQSFCQDMRVVIISPLRSTLSVLCNLWRRAPLQVLYYRSAAMRRLVDQMLAENQFDVVYVDLTDIISQEIVRSMPYRGLVSRLVYRLETPRIQRYERHVAEIFEETWLISEAGKRVLSTTCSAANIRVVPIGIDEDRLYPTGQPCEPNSLIFVGHLRVFHNVDAVTHLVQDVLPLVRQQIPSCTLKIVGADPNSQVRRLASDPAVTVTGFVPDLNDHLNRAAVFVAPLRFAAGVQTKVLEAMAVARPVVTTSVVNMGLEAQQGQEVLVADDVATMANQIITLLRDEQLRTQIGRAGLEFIRRKYTWDHVVKRMNAIEEHLSAKRAGSSMR